MASAGLSPDDAAFFDPAITGEVIEVWGERPDKPFDRDTALRLTGEELAERGVTNLAEALELVPELNVRTAGRGGQQVDIRGARKGSVKILIDGVPVDDPFYGTFDISSIPITDIVQIRVSATPSSPVDGAGGPGGVIEVHTRDAMGARRVEARIHASSLPEAAAAVTARTPLGTHWAARPSVSATLGARDFTAPGATNVAEDRHAIAGALRLEYRRGERRVATDVWAQHRSFVVPPGEENGNDILVIEGESAARAGIMADDRLGAWQMQGRLYAHTLSRQSTYYSDAALTEPTRSEDLSSSSMGGGFLANRPFARDFHAILSAVVTSEAADVMDFAGAVTSGRQSVGEAAAGLQYEAGKLTVDAAAGLAVPVGIDAAPWPEAKLAVSVRPVHGVGVKLTGARKGRVPSLRERFRTDVGNEALEPELAWFGEAAVSASAGPWASLDVAAYLRDLNGLIRFDASQGTLVNVGRVTMRGIDSRLALLPGRMLNGGASLSITEAEGEETGSDPLDFLPRYRGDVWARASWKHGLGGLVRVRYIGERLDRGTTLPSYTVVDVSASARLGAGLSGHLRMDNVLDNRYDIRANGVLAPGRIIMASLQGEWQ